MKYNFINIKCICQHFSYQTKIETIKKNGSNFDRHLMHRQLWLPCSLLSCSSAETQVISPKCPINLPQLPPGEIWRSIYYHSVIKKWIMQFWNLVVCHLYVCVCLKLLNSKQITGKNRSSNLEVLNGKYGHEWWQLKRSRYFNSLERYYCDFSVCVSTTKLQFVCLRY